MLPKTLRKNRLTMLKWYRQTTLMRQSRLQMRPAMLPKTLRRNRLAVVKRHRKTPQTVVIKLPKQSPTIAKKLWKRPLKKVP